MDEFKTGTETAFRKNAADFFTAWPGPGPAGAAAEIGAIWRGLEGPQTGGDEAASPGSRLSRHVSILEEAARHDPRLGRELSAWRAAAAPPDPVEAIACRLGRAAGAAAHVLEAGARAAREKGCYSSSLMDFRGVQERLAGLVSGAELARLGAWRLCRLLERGQADRAAFESGALDARAAALEAEVRSLAGSLLGRSWVEASLDADEIPYFGERTP